jgi:Asp-tRNA(Asn)/Glu-tRNA(Gln) amidotransferase A subunit family amidase
MDRAPSPIANLLRDFVLGTASLEAATSAALARANGNAGRNTYLALEAEWSLDQARALTKKNHTGSLAGIPVALKDCFDLEGFHTSSGSRFYAGHLPAASSDSWVAARLKAAGAVITGKTHLHQLAYGITGENRDYGDCLQPRARRALRTYRLPRLARHRRLARRRASGSLLRYPRLALPRPARSAPAGKRALCTPRRRARRREAAHRLSARGHP